jgi:hypothetical protein
MFPVSTNLALIKIMRQNRAQLTAPYPCLPDQALSTFCHTNPPNAFPHWQAALEQNWLHLAPLTHLLPKNLTLALLYLLHVSRVCPTKAPTPAPNDPLSPQTLKALRAFGNWISCTCCCGRRWNFANSLNGLRDDHQRAMACVPRGWKDAKDPDKVQEVEPAAPRLFKQNVRKWYAKQEYPVAAWGS